MSGKKLRRLVETRVTNNIFKGFGYKEVKFELGKHMAELEDYTVHNYLKKGSDSYLPTLSDLKDILEIFGTTEVNNYNIYSKGVYLELNRMYRYLQENNLWEFFYTTIEQVIIHRTMLEYMYVDKSNWGYLHTQLIEAIQQGTDLPHEIELVKGGNVVRVGTSQPIHITYSINLKNIQTQLYGLNTPEQFETQLMYVVDDSLTLSFKYFRTT